MGRTSNDNEFWQPPEEFPAPAAQMTPPPEEFGSGGQDAPARKKKRKFHWLAAAVAAGLLSTVAMFSGIEEAIVEPIASPTPFAAAAAATPAPKPTPDHTPSPSPVPTTPSPEPTETPKPTPTPAIDPDARLVFYRTSEVYHLQIMLEAQEKISAVTARMVDRGNNGETIWEHVFTEEEISFGWYFLSDFNLYGEEYVKAHMDLIRQGYEPDPVLEVTYTARTDDGIEETVSKQADPVYELWVSARYDLDNQAEDFLYYFMEETTYPGCFVVRIDPTPYGDLNIYYGEGLELQPGDVFVTVTVDGQQIPADSCYLIKTEIVSGQGTLYGYAFVMPRPDSFPEHGKAEITLGRRLIHYANHTKTDTKFIDY